MHEIVSNDDAIAFMITVVFWTIVFVVEKTNSRRGEKRVLFNAYTEGLAAAGELDELMELLEKEKRRWGREARRRRRVLEAMIFNLRGKSGRN